MKVGLSLSRCVRDIFDGKVKFDEVLVIIARTDFDPTNDQQWKNIWDGYSGARISASYLEWSDYRDHEAEFRKICQDLYFKGLIHQPRKFGANPRRLPYHWYDVVLSHSLGLDNPAAQKAWDKYKTIAGLVK